MTTCAYLNAYFEVFIAPTMCGLQVKPEAFQVIETNLRNCPDEHSKRRAIADLLIAIEHHHDTQHQWISDRDEAILEELERLLNEICIPSIEVPLTGRFKLYCDLIDLQKLLDHMSTELHCDDISYFIKEMMRCTPHSALQYEMLIKTGQLKVYYNRLAHLVDRLKHSEFDGQSEYDVQTAILMAYSKIEIVGTEEPMIISDEKEEFMVQWRAKVFDNRPPESLYPPQKMYRNMPYCKTEPDGWIFAHRAQMKYMDGVSYWLKSPIFTQLEESVRFAFYHYENIGKRNLSIMPVDYLPSSRTWSLANIPELPQSHIAPNATFKAYYDETVEDFCRCVEQINEDRTDSNMLHVYTQASKIRVMSEWMKCGIDGVKVERFIILACLRPVAEVKIDLSNQPTVLYRKLIDYFAYAVCMNESTDRVIQTLKMCNSIVV